MMVFGVPSALAKPKAKVKICHIPPGNPANFHTISVSENALPAHLAHGDLTGTCDENLDILCDDANPCTIDVDPASGTCSNDPRPPVDCDDSNACTTDSCNPESGCISSPRDCNDNDECTIDTCNPTTGECQSVDVACEEGSFCDPGTGLCDNPCDGTSCEPIDQCHEAGTCSVVVDEQGNLVPLCDNPPLPDDTPCDGDTGTCQAGICVPNPPDPCWNGEVDPEETCDDGNTTPGDGCSETCQIEEVCGDNVVTPPEQCDDGNTTPGDGCSEACVEEFCGDGTVQAGIGEQCETGVCCDTTTCQFNVLGTTCETDIDPCTVQECTGTSATMCKVVFDSCKCGNSEIDDGEQCDDSSNVCCTSECQWVPLGTLCDDGNACTGPGPDSCQTVPVFGDQVVCTNSPNPGCLCGNGVVDIGEQCDDSNVLNGDCCDSRCQLEPFGGQCDSDNNPCTEDICVPGPFCAPTGAILCVN